MNPKTTVGCIIEKDNKILLALRNHEPFKDYWCLPGGHIEFNEKAIDAVKREVKEETGLDINPKFFCYDDEIFKSIKWHAVVIIFTSKPIGKIKRQKKEIKDIKQFDKKGLVELPMAFNHKRILKDYFKIKNG
ncbi:MAG: NUDIX hydrolase [Candidatus Woesearchaeota archaeon]|jgi:8-oxo-dGTP diphosphatase|nr:NUDIX hydrolase [Candidatus Woesearchaeota archaeon]|tara:strand:+ start:349 stop:747 length:399 start_codon:yes stop_codon:yes gene_type:complete